MAFQERLLPLVEKILNAPNPLFRSESIEARRLNWLGRPAIAHGTPYGIFALVCVLLVAAAISLVVFGEYTRRVRVSGTILPTGGLTRMSATQPGWIRSLNIKEGDHVAMGDPLYVINLDNASALGDTQDTLIGLLRRTRAELQVSLDRQRELRALEKKTLTSKKLAMTLELSKIEDQTGILDEAILRARAYAEKQQLMLGRGLGVASSYENSMSILNSQLLQLGTLQRERAALISRIEEASGELESFDLETQSKASELEHQILAVDQKIAESEEKREMVVKAPRAGVVTNIAARSGQTVERGSPLLTIVPDGSVLTAQLLVPSRAIGFVRAGQKVLLRYDAFPFQKFGQYSAHISVVSRAAMRSEDLAEFDVPGEDPRRSISLYRVDAAPAEQFVSAFGRREALKAGMQVEADVLADTRPLYEWLFEPIYSLQRSASVAGGNAN